MRHPWRSWLLSWLLFCLLIGGAAQAAPAQLETNAEHDPPPQAAQPLPAPVVQAFDEALERKADLLDALYGAMRVYNASDDGILYSMNLNNAWDADWLQQTPTVWGKPAAAVSPGAGGAVAAKVRTLVAGARGFVDIVSLSPFPSGDFEAAIISGLQAVARSGNRVTVRILVGWYPPDRDSRLDQRAYLRRLIAALKPIPGSHLKIYAAAMQVVGMLGWNHAKLVAVDGQNVLLGGENLWHPDYLDRQPAHDLNVALRGPVVRDMHRFIDTLWRPVCAYVLPGWWPAYWQSGWNDIATMHYCLSQNDVKPPPGAGSLRVLGAGRLGLLAPPALRRDPADVAMALALRSSRSTIRLSQQDLGATDPVTGWVRCWWDEGMTSLAKALVKKQHVYVVLTNDGAKAGPETAKPPLYWNKIPLTETADKIKEYVQKQPGAPQGPALRKLLCENLHLAPLRFGPDAKWPNGWTFANHAKFFMVDDSLFYVGSENFYPAPLQEYGVFLNDPKVAAQMKEQYWDRLWSSSSAAAISGSETSNCYFK